MRGIKFVKPTIKIIRVLALPLVAVGLRTALTPFEGPRRVIGFVLLGLAVAAAFLLRRAVGEVLQGMWARFLHAGYTLLAAIVPAMTRLVGRAGPVLLVVLAVGEWRVLWVTELTTAAEYLWFGLAHVGVYAGAYVLWQISTHLHTRLLEVEERFVARRQLKRHPSARVRSAPSVQTARRGERHRCARQDGTGRTIFLVACCPKHDRPAFNSGAHYLAKSAVLGGGR